MDYQIRTVYQPIVSDGNIVAFEALVRPEILHVVVSPDKWFEDMIVQGEGEMAEQRAIQSSLHHFSDSSSLLFMNIIPKHLENRSFVDWLCCRYYESDFLRSRVVVELLESVPYDSKIVKGAIEVLRQAGIRVALDDVGVGAHTIEMLLNLMPDYIKLDRLFCSNLPYTPVYHRFLEFLLQTLGEDKVIAEGVETEQQAQYLFSLGISLQQGYYWGRPMSSLLSGGQDETSIDS